MNLDLKDKRILVTGASKGIGLACALSFAREEAIPILVARNADGLKQAAEQIRQATGVIAETIAIDLAEPGSVETVSERAGTVDCLINNAGAIPSGSLEQMDGARWQEAWKLKPFGYIDLARIYLPLMQARGHGVIVNIIGMAGVAHRSAYIAGTMADAGLIAFTNALGSASTAHGVRVSGSIRGRRGPIG